jgi:putative methyltransferase (TIGR04325 family)
MPTRSSLQQVAQEWLPPVLYRLLRRHLRPQWKYVGGEWPSRDPRAEGWDDPSVTRVLEACWPRYQALAASPEPWAYWPWETTGRDAAAHHNLLTFAYAAARCSADAAALSVLDWGGTFGHFAAIARAAAPRTDIHYVVKDRPAICAAGAKLNASVTFISSDEEAFARRYDLVLASNALQYASDWRDTAARLAAASQRWLLILAFPTVRASPSFVVVQRPQGVGFAEDYISWVFNRDEFLTHIADCGFVLEQEFVSIGELDASGAPEIAKHVGFLFKRRAATDAVRHAGAAHHRPS